jgi:hypothetical protein
MLVALLSMDNQHYMHPLRNGLLMLLFGSALMAAAISVVRLLPVILPIILPWSWNPMRGAPTITLLLIPVLWFMVVIVLVTAIVDFVQQALTLLAKIAAALDKLTSNN